MSFRRWRGGRVLTRRTTGAAEQREPELRDQAAAVRDGCMAHLCFYGALSLLRNAGTGSTQMGRKEQLSKIASILATFDALPSQPWGVRLVGELKAAIVPTAGL